MSFLADLEREIERIASAAGPVRARRRWWRRSTALLVLAPLTVATVAVAATTGILSGEPVKNPPGSKQDPKAGVGVNAGPGTLFAVQPADPVDGPPWGLRLVKTSRGLGCVQVGRVVDGQLGFLGRDGAFGNDGKFHPLGAEVLETTQCQQADGAGNVFIAVTAIGLPASGDGTGCRPRENCPEGSLRDVFFGLLGPEATAITYREDGRLVRQTVAGPEGAYLVVRATEPGSRNVGWWSPNLSPAWVESIEFRDGSVCRPDEQPRRNGSKRCPLKGYVTPELDIAAREDVASPLQVKVGTKPELPPDLPPGTRTPNLRAITITFRARRAADAKSFYTISTEKNHGGPRCAQNTFGPIARDIEAGATVTETRWVGFSCRGTMKIRVGYTQQRKPSMMPFMADGRPNPKVGTAVAKQR